MVQVTPQVTSRKPQKPADPLEDAVRIYRSPDDSVYTVERNDGTIEIIRPPKSDTYPHTPAQDEQMRRYMEVWSTLEYAGRTADDGREWYSDGYDFANDFGFRYQRQAVK